MHPTKSLPVTRNIVVFNQLLEREIVSQFKGADLCWGGVEKWLVVGEIWIVIGEGEGESSGVGVDLLVIGVVVLVSMLVSRESWAGVEEVVEGSESSVEAGRELRVPEEEFRGCGFEAFISSQENLSRLCCSIGQERGVKSVV